MSCISAERFNHVSHLAGAILALVGLLLLMLRAIPSGESLRIVSYAVYGITLFYLYFASTLYHGHNGSVKPLLQKLDHQAIYLLIAGTYTPFCLVTLRDSVGLWLFAAIWSLALSGIVFELCYESRRRIVPVLIYLFMGWLVLFTLQPVIDGLSASGFLWLLAGGLFYTLGIAFYVLDHWYAWAHCVWHLFVLAGSACHFFSILLHV